MTSSVAPPQSHGLSIGRLLPVASGYLAGCVIGGIGAGIWWEILYPSDGRALFSVGVMIAVALVICAPTYFLGRGVLFSFGPLRIWRHLLLWIIAGSLPPLFAVPGPLALFTALFLLPFGAAAGVAAYIVETRLR